MAKRLMGSRLAPGENTPADQTGEGLERYTFSQLHMGGEVRLSFYASNALLAEDAARAAFARYAELEQVMSDYRPSSELMQLCAQAGNGPVVMSSDLYKVVELSLDVSRLSLGAFDITASPVVRLWREARRTGVLPTFDARRSALSLVGWEKIVLNGLHQTVALSVPGMLLDLGGIAKGYANDEALTTLSMHGVSRAMVEAGGDISTSGPPPGTQGWVIKVQGNDNPLYLSHAAISTSGDSEQFVEIEGVRYSHVVDPRTGIGVTNRVQATVIAPRGVTSDPWATALCVDPGLEIRQEITSSIRLARLV